LRNLVIITGHRQATLESVTAANPGMQMAGLDIDDADAIRAFAQKAAAAFPTLNGLVNNAGIQRPEDLRTQGEDLTTMEAMVTTNLLGPIRLTAALLPLLRRQPRSTVINVTSALAFVPGSGVPTYSATKAAMHSYTMSLREQLKSTSKPSRRRRPGRARPSYRTLAKAAAYWALQTVLVAFFTALSSATASLFMPFPPVSGRYGLCLMLTYRPVRDRRR
jgi:NADP-dependent 3-hydroxy acid dehydrogenase YdfG